MSILKDIKLWLTDLLCISNYDRKVERKFRKMRRLYGKGGFINRIRALRLENKLQEKYQLKISRRAKIGENFQIRHPMGIRIGATVEIGDNCKVYPFFVAMAAVKNDEELNRNHVRRHPKIGNDCLLGSKASVIGPVTIGDDVIIGACAIVTKDVPSHSVVKGLNQVRPKRLEEIPDKYKVKQ
jgi:serine O-acetyltransferase